MNEHIYKEQLVGEEGVDFEFNMSLGAKFTEDEIESLENVLCKHDKNNVINFINSIQTICRFKYNCENERDTSTDIRKNRKGIIKSLKNSLEKLELMTMPTYRFDKHKLNICDNIIPDIKIHPELELVMPEWHEDFISLKTKAENLHEILDNFLVEFIEFDNKSNKLYSKGRKYADYDGFYRQIAEAFQKYIGKPNKQKNGDFTNVMRVLLKAVGGKAVVKKIDGNPIDDPSKGVIQALEKMA